MILKRCDECGCQLEPDRCFIHKNKTLCYHCHCMEFDRIMNVMAEFSAKHTCTYCEQCGHKIYPCVDIHVYNKKAFCSSDCILEYIGAYELEFSCKDGADNEEYMSYFPKTEVKMAIQKIDEKTYAFGKYNGHTLIWDVIDKDADECDRLLLCRELVCCRKFDGKSNDWEDSELRDWLNSVFLLSFDKEEKDRIIMINDCYFFLLSTGEYNDYKENIISHFASWWLRSPGHHTSEAKKITYENIYDTDIFVPSIGVRPAVFMRLPLSKNNPQSDEKYYITNIRRCTVPGLFEYTAEHVHEIKKFYCDDEKTTKKLWEMVRGENRPVKLSFDKTTNNNNDLKRLIDIYD